ncbi:MAG: hypothetical protein R3A52_01225 [Polyangiales bacterium]
MRLTLVGEKEVWSADPHPHWIADNGETTENRLRPRHFGPAPGAARPAHQARRAVESRLAKLTATVKQQLSVALSDGHDMVDRVAADAEYHGKYDPAFAEDRYEVLVDYRLRSQSVIEGRERARRARQSKKANGARTPTAQKAPVASDKHASDKPASDKPASDKPADKPAA